MLLIQGVINVYSITSLQYRNFYNTATPIDDVVFCSSEEIAKMSDAQALDLHQPLGNQNMPRNVGLTAPVVI